MFIYLFQYLLTNLTSAMSQKRCVFKVKVFHCMVAAILDLYESFKYRQFSSRNHPKIGFKSCSMVYYVILYLHCLYSSIHSKHKFCKFDF